MTNLLRAVVVTTFVAVSTLATREPTPTFAAHEDTKANLTMMSAPDGEKEKDRPNPYRAPVPLFLPQEHKLALDPAALDAIENLPGPFYSVAAIGPARVGKSFWMGRLAKEIAAANIAAERRPELPEEARLPDEALRYKNAAPADRSTPDDLPEKVLESVFAVSDTSESCTAGVWVLAVDLGPVLHHVDGVSGSPAPAADAAIKGPTLLLFDLQGSDKGSEQDVLATDQLSAFVSLFSGAVAVLPPPPRGDVEDGVPGPAAIRRQGAAERLQPRAEGELRGAALAAAAGEVFDSRGGVPRGAPGPVGGPGTSGVELPEIELPAEEHNPFSSDEVLRWTKRLLREAVFAVAGREDDVSTKELLQLELGAVVPAYQSLRLQTSDGTALDGPGVAQLMRQVSESLLAPGAHLDEFFLVQESLQERVCRRRLAAFEEKLEQSPAYGNVLSAIAVAGKTTREEDGEKEFVQEDPLFRAAFFDWCRDEAHREQAMAMVREKLEKIRSGGWFDFRFVARTIGWLSSSLSKAVAGIANSALRYGFPAVALFALGCCGWLVTQGARSHDASRSFRARAAAKLAKVLIAICATLFAFSAKAVCAIVPCFLLGNKSFRQYYDPLVYWSKDALQYAAERLCSFLYAAKDQDSGSDAQLERGAELSATAAGGAGASSAWCSYGSYFLVEFFGRNIDYLLYAVLITVIWFVVPMLLHEILLRRLVFPVLFYLFPFSEDEEQGPGSSRFSGGGKNYLDDGAGDRWNQTGFYNPTEGDSWSPRSPGSPGFNAVGTYGTYEPSDSTSTTRYNSQSSTITAIFSLYHRCKSRVRRLIYEEWLRYERRPLLANRASSWDLGDESEHRSFTERQIAALQTSAEYKWRCQVQGFCAEVPSCWEWGAHYAKYADGNFLHGAEHDLRGGVTSGGILSVTPARKNGCGIVGSAASGDAFEKSSRASVKASRNTSATSASSSSKMMRGSSKMSTPPASTKKERNTNKNRKGKAAPVVVFEDGDDGGVEGDDSDWEGRAVADEIHRMYDLVDEAATRRSMRTVF
eukprot:CAMPEP_0178991134 /NCGR_PEP_ID=MMETSP0795-20121207/5352_1 /TAXON_ID=88552 /ORGANISM="Amoebophrya sp., Strain Ameob2" /LENGTH=1037 /DNA_ID=CAMNT_0020682795 /DNA_START=178 /DNA_END=3291 /DNA_ORIENTATION=-